MDANAVDELRKQIVEQIKEAFKDVEQPIGHTLSSDRGSLGRMLKEHWSNVHVDTLKANLGRLPVLRAEYQIFTHYLPAFLIATLIYQDNETDWLYVLIALDPTALIGLQKDLERQSLFRFTPEQAKAIVAFLESLAAFYPREMSLSRSTLPPEADREFERLIGVPPPPMPSDRLPILLNHWRAMADGDEGTKISPIQVK
jgi:hypothetical protein